MSLFVRLDIGFWKHRKTMRLRSIIGESALWIPPRLWSYAAQNQPDGDFSAYLPTEIAMLVECSVEPQALLEALQASGFMDGMKIHGWADHNGYHEKFAERAKKAAAARWEKRGKDKKGEGEDKRREEKRQALLADTKSNACSILEHLNSVAGKGFRSVETNLEFIQSRLGEGGVTPDGCRKMIERQVQLWKGTEQEEYLRPSTLFNKTKFAGYYDSREQPVIPRVQAVNGNSAEALHKKVNPEYGW